MTATITFSDGTVLEGIEKNAECYIAGEKPDFPETIEGVIIESEDGTRELENAVLVECASVDGRYWFAFNEKPAEQIEKEELEADLEAQAEAIQELAEIIAGMEE